MIYDIFNQSIIQCISTLSLKYGLSAKKSSVRCGPVHTTSGNATRIITLNKLTIRSNLSSTAERIQLFVLPHKFKHKDCHKQFLLLYLLTCLFSSLTTNQWNCELCKDACWYWIGLRVNGETVFFLHVNVSAGQYCGCTYIINEFLCPIISPIFKKIHTSKLHPKRAQILQNITYGIKTILMETHHCPEHLSQHHLIK